MVSCRCTTRMTREFRARSSCAILRVRIASIMRCRSTGCNADSMKNSQKRSSTDMSAPHEVEAEDPLVDVSRPVGSRHESQRRSQGKSADEAADMCPPGDRATR